MKLEKLNINNIDIYILRNNKFNTIKISTLLINELSYNNFTKEKLLSNYLSRSINDYKDELSLSKRFLELYDPHIGIFDFYLNNHVKSFDLTMLNEKYTEKGMFKKTIDLYYSFIFNPNVVDNKFDKQNLELSKNSLKTRYRALKEDPNYLAYNRAFKLIDEDIPSKYDTDGNENELNINEKELYDFYKEEIKNSEIKIVITGDINDEIIDYIKDNIKLKTNKKYNFKNYAYTNKVKEVIEKTDIEKFNQSKLIYIYKILNMTKRERQYVSLVFNTILGGSNSKLFKNVREKESLCYYVYSNINSFTSYMDITAGISKENENKTKTSIEKEVNSMLNGNITDKELKEAKETIITSLIARDDIQSSFIGRMIDYALEDLEIDIKEITKNIKSVTKEELVEFGNKLDLNVVYFLKGDK